MKKSLVISLLILLTSFSFAQKNEYKIYPVDESENDTVISQFVGVLKEIIAEKDTSRLYSLLDEKVVTSFGGAIYGKQGFIENWNLQKPENSVIWESMRKIIDMGGVFDIGGVFKTTTDNMIFQFPYANSNKLFDSIYKKNPEYNFEPHATIVCVKENVPIFENPNNNSVIVSSMSYDVLTVNYEKTNEEVINKSTGYWEWIYVTTIDKSTTGWMLNNNDIYFLGGLTLVIEKINDEYKITGFFPYD